MYHNLLIYDVKRSTNEGGMGSFNGSMLAIGVC